MQSAGRTISDEMVENIGRFGLRNDAVCGHQVQNWLCAQHGKKRVGVGVVGPGRIERCLRCSAPVVVPWHLRRMRDKGEPRHIRENSLASSDRSSSPAHTSGRSARPDTKHRRLRSCCG